MSSRRSRGSSIKETEIKSLTRKLEAIVSNNTRGCSKNAASLSKALEEACDQIKRLHDEVDNLSEKISQIICSLDINSDQEDILNRLLQQLIEML